MPGPQSWHGCFVEKYHAFAGNHSMDRPARSPFTIPAALSELFHHTQPNYKYSFAVSMEIKKKKYWAGILMYFFFPMPPPVLMNFVVFPPGCGDGITDF